VLPHPVAVGGGLVPLAAAAALRSAPDVVAAILAGDPPGWARIDDVAGQRRYAVDLRLRLGGDHGFAIFGKAAYVDLGDSRPTPEGVDVPIGWQASTAAPLFPVFAGVLRLDGRTLELHGMYAPPGGALGRLADRALLHVAASGTARWLLHEIDGWHDATMAAAGGAG
jgi:hypothetical protein